MLFVIGAIFLAYGVWVPRARSHSPLGIRTLWTLESEQVWRETHKLAGRTFMVGGVVTIAAAFMPSDVQPLIAIGALLVAGFVPAIYSYIARQREKKRAAQSPKGLQ